MFAQCLSSVWLVLFCLIQAGPLCQYFEPEVQSQRRQDVEPLSDYAREQGLLQTYDNNVLTGSRPSIIEFGGNPSPQPVFQPDLGTPSFITGQPVAFPSPSIPTVVQTPVQGQLPVDQPVILSPQPEPAPAPSPVPEVAQPPVQVQPLPDQPVAFPSPSIPTGVQTPVQVQPPANQPVILSPPPAPAPAPVPVLDSTTPQAVIPFVTQPTPALINVNQEQQQQCYIRTCDQTITGRDLTYARALEIVQEEEYLTEADRSVIRRRLLRRQTRSEDDDDEDDDLFLGTLVHGTREGRQKVTNPVTTVTPTFVTPTFVTPTTTSTAADPVVINQPIGIPTPVLVAAAVYAAVGLGLALVPPAPPPPPPPPPPPAAQPVPAQVTAPLPGAIGGGALPLLGLPFAATALALVPPGTTPVSIFPPYETPRTFAAVGVVFREGASFKRRQDARPGFWQRWKPFWGRWHRSKRSLDWRKRVRRTWQGWLHGTKSRLSRFFSPRRHKSDYHDQYHHYQPTNNGVNSDIDFENDLFGFRIRVRLVDKQPCTLGVTCDANGNKIGPGSDFTGSTFGSSPRSRGFDFSGYLFAKRQAGEFFSAEGPPECRTELNPNGCQ